MNLRSSLLFAVPTLIWGSTWFAIKFQIGVVDPLLSVAYRFFLASALLFLYCVFFRLKLRFSLRDHGGMMLLGVLLFGFNYWLVYKAENHLTSGLVAVVFSGLIFANIFFGAIALRAAVRPRVIGGALLGISGLALIFRAEITSFGLDNHQFGALLLAILSVMMASMGNILSAFNQRRKVPVVQANAFGMMYGALAVFLVALLSGAELRFDPGFAYVTSLLYLSLFGSVVAFGAYLRFLGEEGPDRAGYVSMVMPVIALLLSTLFEDYRWTFTSIAGVPLILAGYFIALRYR